MQAAGILPQRNGGLWLALQTMPKGPPLFGDVGGKRGAGESLWEALSVNAASDHKRITLKMIMMFNAVTGYFLSQKILDQAQMGSVLDPENLAAQKQLMAGVMQVFADA